MKSLIKIGLILGGTFASTFLLSQVFDVITFANIRQVLYNIQHQPDLIVGIVVTTLLFLDIFIAVPTMTIILLSGYFLGFTNSLVFVFVGLFAAAITGYFISLKWGEKLLRFIEKDFESQQKMKKLFHQHGSTMLIISRAMPILPEVTACLAGICKMPFRRFIFSWLMGTIPYAFIAAYSGSISDLNNPSPAIFGAILISGCLWVAWYYFIKRNNIKV